MNHVNRIIYFVVIVCLGISNVFSQESSVENLHLWPSQTQGLNTKFLPYQIQDTQFQDCSNVYFDETTGVISRGGYANFNTIAITSSSVRFLDEFSRVDGSRYMIAVSSHTMAFTSSGTFVTLISTLNRTSVIWGTSYNNKYYIGEDVGDSWEFDGAVLRSTGIPHAKYAITEFNRIFVANINESGGGSKIEYSEIGEPGNFSPLNYIYYNKDDGETITGIFSYAGNIYVTKAHSIGILIGVDDETTTNDGVLPVIKGIGCLYNSTIKLRNNTIIFQSHRGIEEFDGTNITLLSEIISPTLTNTTQNIKDNRSDIDTLKSEFEGGNSWFGVTLNNDDTITSVHKQTMFTSPSTTESSLGDIKIDSLGNPHIVYRNYYNLEDKTRIYYSSWTGTAWNVNTSTTVTISTSATQGQFSNDIVLELDSKNNAWVLYADYTGHLYISSITNNVWTFIQENEGIGLIDNPGNNQELDFKLDSVNNPHFAFRDTGNDDLYYSSYTKGVGWTRAAVDSTGDVGTYCSIDLDSNNKPFIVYHDVTNYGIKIASFNYTTGAWFKRSISQSSEDPNIVEGLMAHIKIDSNDNPWVAYVSTVTGIGKAQYLYIATYTPTASSIWSYKTIDTLIYENYVGSMFNELDFDLSSKNIPYMAVITNMDTSNMKGLKYYYYDNGNYVHIVEPDVEEYVSAEMAMMEDRPLILYYDNYLGQARVRLYSKYSYYLSELKDISNSDTPFSSWRTFEVTETKTSPDVINYYLFTANTSATISNSSFTITDGQQINSAYQPFIKYLAIYDVAFPSTTNVITLSDVTINWIVNKNPFLPCGIVEDSRYWYSAAEIPETKNNIVLVLDKNNNWTKFTNLNARSFGIYNSKLYFGSSDDNGLVYAYDDSYTTDASTAIPTMIHTKDFDLGSYINDKRISKEGLWTATTPTTKYDEMTVDYYVNLSTTAEYTEYISLTADTAYPNKPIVTNIPKKIDRLRYINFKFSNFDKFIGADLFYEKQMPTNK